MIPAIRRRIDEENSATANNGHRERIPDSEKEELSQFRRTEHIRQAREDRNAMLMVVAEAMAQPEPVQENPVDRPFGLPKGENPLDTWEMILVHIQDPEDIIRASDTCRLFRELLRTKYKAVRLVEVTRLIIQFEDDQEDESNLLNFRRVCRSSKASVDELFLRDTLSDTWFPSSDDWIAQLIPKPQQFFDTYCLEKLQRIVTSLEEQNFPNLDDFPLRTIVYEEIDEEDEDPEGLAELRPQFERLLGSIGGSVRSFGFRSTRNDLLRRWLALMPNLVELEVEMYGDPYALQLQPFPACPKLKRYTISGSSARPALAAQIFHANPTISEVSHIHYDSSEDLQESEEFDQFFRLLENAEQVTSFRFDGMYGIPSFHFLELRFQWPLKLLSIVTSGPEDRENQVIPSRTLFGFINQFGNTLEELTILFKVRDTGGYLDLPNVTKLMWKLSQDFMNLEFFIALGKLQSLDLEVTACDRDQISGSWGNVKRFIDGSNLKTLFPGLMRIRAFSSVIPSRDFPSWRTIWKS